MAAAEQLKITYNPDSKNYSVPLPAPLMDHVENLDANEAVQLCLQLYGWETGHKHLETMRQIKLHDRGGLKRAIQNVYEHNVAVLKSTTNLHRGLAAQYGLTFHNWVYERSQSPNSRMEGQSQSRAAWDIDIDKFVVKKEYEIDSCNQFVCEVLWCNRGPRLNIFWGGFIIVPLSLIFVINGVSLAINGTNKSQNKLLPTIVIVFGLIVLAIYIGLAILYAVQTKKAVRRVIELNLEIIQSGANPNPASVNAYKRIHMDLLHREYTVRARNIMILGNSIVVMFILAIILSIAFRDAISTLIASILGFIVGVCGCILLVKSPLCCGEEGEGLGCAFFKLL